MTFPTIIERETAAITSMATGTIVTLPVELRIKICASLSLAETCRLRQVSKSFKVLLDDDQNANEIARPYLHFHRIRLQSSIDDLCSPKLEFFDAFVNFTTHYGLLNLQPNTLILYPDPEKAERLVSLYQSVSPSATLRFHRADVENVLEDIVAMFQYPPVITARGPGLLAAWKEDRCQNMIRKLQSHELQDVL